MDKNKVIEAYYRGLLTIDECAKILGFEQERVSQMIDSSWSGITFHSTVSTISQMEQA